MALISSASKSGRLLASRRYTHETLTDAQESFTNVLDLQASETYTQAAYIPSSSLPFSGSSQINLSHRVSGSNVFKYWHRHKLTKSNTNNEVWFFLNPTGSNSGVGAQLINDNQEVNFISPKYGTSALANTTAEDSTPGYLAVVYKSTATNTSSLGGGDIVSTNDYQFDYKTGVVQFMNSEVDPSNSQYVFMTVYQYVGKTLATGVEISGNISGSVSSTGSFGYLNVDGDAVIGGNLTFGDANTDSVSFSAEINSDFVPDADSTYDIGSSAKNWKFGYIEELSVTNVTASGYISGSSTSTGSFGSLVVADKVQGDLTIRDSLTVNKGLTVNNNQEAAYDFIVKSQNKSHTLYVDSNKDKVGIGFNSPAGQHLSSSLHVAGDIFASGTGGHITASGNISSSGGVSVFGQVVHLEGTDPRLKLKAKGANHPGVEWHEDSTRKWVLYNDPDESDKLVIKNDSTDLLKLTQAGNLGVTEQIYHIADTDTKITFTADDINITVGNVNMVDFTEGANDEITFNVNYLKNVKSIYKFYGEAKKKSIIVCEATFSAMIINKSSAEIF